MDEDAVRFGVDRVIVRGRRVFGWGWAWHAAQPIQALALVVAGDGWECRLPADYGRERSDVREAFPEAAEAGASGFLVTGYAPRTDIKSIALEIHEANGAIARRDVTRFADVGAPGRRKRRQAAYLLRAVGRRIARGDWRGIVRRARAQNYLAPALADDDAARTLAARIGADRRVVLVFDHNMGGGANVYREALLEERVRAGSTALLCTYNLPTLDYRVELRAAGGEREIYRLASFLPLDALLDHARIHELFVNSAVSFDEPLVFAEWIAMMRARHPQLRLVVAIHDYFVACPSFVLLDHAGRYCGVPGLAACERCLSRHHASYVALSPPTTIGQWRSAWARGLAAADEVRCFSESTRRLLLRAHQALDGSRITVVPHRPDFVPRRLPRLAHAAPLTIGIIGHISRQKGALVVRDMLARIDREGRDVRIVVIGTLDVRVASPRLRVTGAYARDELPERIEREAVNLMLFPSVCPETFSYAVEEMIAMRLPIVAFDLGAPGDRLRDFPDARLCATVSADAALDTLEAFHRDLAARAAHRHPHEASADRQ